MFGLIVSVPGTMWYLQQVVESPAPLGDLSAAYTGALTAAAAVFVHKGVYFAIYDATLALVPERLSELPVFHVALGLGTTVASSLLTYPLHFLYMQQCLQVLGGVPVEPVTVLATKAAASSSLWTGAAWTGVASLVAGLAFGIVNSGLSSLLGLDTDDERRMKADAVAERGKREKKKI